MREPLDDFALGSALRDGLQALPVPDLGTDFDARILDALRAPGPWWRRVWAPARPLLLGASCSLSVTLILLHWTLTAPVTAPFPAAASAALAAAPSCPPSLDRLLDRPNLRAGSLAAVWGSPLTPNSGGTGENPPDRRPEPPRHARAGRRPRCLA